VGPILAFTLNSLLGSRGCRSQLALREQHLTSFQRGRKPTDAFVLSAFPSYGYKSESLGCGNGVLVLLEYSTDARMHIACCKSLANSVTFWMVKLQMIVASGRKCHPLGAKGLWNAEMKHGQGRDRRKDRLEAFLSPMLRIWGSWHHEVFWGPTVWSWFLIEHGLLLHASYIYPRWLEFFWGCCFQDCHFRLPGAILVITLLLNEVQDGFWFEGWAASKASFASQVRRNARPTLNSKI